MDADHHEEEEEGSSSSDDDRPRYDYEGPPDEW